MTGDASSGARHELQRRFYNAAYTPGRGAPEPWLNRSLRRFELHRSDAVRRLVRPGGRLLDVGSGDGTFALRCAPRFETVIGADVSDVRVAAAHVRAADAPNVTFVNANLDEGLPFDSEFFDVVTSIAMLQLVFDPIAGVREIRRVLKPGGLLIVQVPNFAYLPRRVTLLVGRLPHLSSAEGWDGGNLHNFTQGALCDLLRAEGLRVEHVTGSGAFASLRSWRPSLLTGDLIMSARKLGR